MREIKFRIWVKDRKEIFEVVLINYVSKKVTYILEKIGHLLSIRDAKFNDIELPLVESLLNTCIADLSEGYLTIGGAGAIGGGIFEAVGKEA